MDIFLTGGTGLVGSAVLTALLADGHRVHALARSDASAATVEKAGATVVRGAVEDTDVLARLARDCDGVVHAAAAADGKDADRDSALLDAVLPVLSGSGKVYVHTSGVWVHGAGTVDEDTPLAPPRLTAWRPPLDARVRAAATDGVRSVLIAPGVVYGGGGLVDVVTGGPRDADGRLVLVGTGEQHWTTVAAADLGRLYARAVAVAAPGSYYLAVSGDNPTVREIGAAAAGPAGVVASTAAEAGTRLGPLAEPLLLDQQATGQRARADLGWEPTEPPLLDTLG